MDKYTRERAEGLLNDIWKDYTLSEIKDIIKMMDKKLQLSKKVDTSSIKDDLIKIVSGCEVVAGYTHYGFTPDADIDMYIKNGKVLFYVDGNDYLHINGKGVTSKIHKKYLITTDDKFKMVCKVFNEVYGTNVNKAGDSFQSWVFKHIYKK